MGTNLQVDASHLVAEGEELRARLQEAAGLFASDVITGSQLSEITSKLRHRLSETERQIQELGTSTALAPFVGGVDANQVWGGLSVDRRRAVIRELMEVVIQPGRRGRDYQPELTQISSRF